MSKPNKYPKSYHIFLFPFEWIPKDAKNEGNLALFPDIFGNWQRRTLENIKDVETEEKVLFYNEYNYFLAFVKQFFYDNGNSDYTRINNSIRHFQYQTHGKSLQYQLQKGTHNYSLKIDKILINLYETGIGVLSFHLVNDIYSEPEDILRINKYSRRIYPSFLKEPHGTLPSSIADKISIWAEDKEIVTTDFLNYANDRLEKQWDSSSQNVKLPRLIRHFLPSLNKTSIIFKPVLGDKMFSISWYGNNEIANELAQKKENNYRFLIEQNEASLFWSKYLFVDVRNEGVKNLFVREQVLTQQSYLRWADMGAFYGISRFSFVCLTPLPDQLGETTYLIDHVRTIYYRLVEVVLLQQASILHFSSLATQVSELQENDRYITDNIRHLYKRYIKFVNKFYFRTITSQEQGIELYNLIKDTMKIDEEVKDLDNEIEELHDYASMLEEKASNKQLDLITRIGALFLIPTFITGFFGMNIFNDRLEAFNMGVFWHMTILFALISILTFLIFIPFRRPGKHITKNIREYLVRLSGFNLLKQSIRLLLWILLIGTGVGLLLIPYWKDQKTYEQSDFIQNKDRNDEMLELLEYQRQILEKQDSLIKILRDK